MTSGELAARAGTTVPRVLRAVARGDVVPAGRGPRGNHLFAPAAVETLATQWGQVPRIPPLSREDVLVLAALSRRPLGVRSARAAARLAGVSPTTARHSLERLRSAGLVEHRIERVVAGRVRDEERWSVHWNAPAWQRIASRVGEAVLPAPRRSRTAPPRRVPRRLHHLFWDVDPASLDLRRHGGYVADRILREGDAASLAWMADRLPRASLEVALRRRGLSTGERNLALALINGESVAAA